MFLKGESPPLGHKESAKHSTLGQKNRAKTPLPGQLLSNIQQNNMNETEIMENSTKMLICLKHLKASWWMALMDIQNISNHFPLIYKPTQEIHGKQVPKYDLINNNC